MTDTAVHILGALLAERYRVVALLGPGGGVCEAEDGRIASWIS